MQKFNINLEIEAESQQQLEEKLQAFQDLQDNMEHQDFVDAVDLIVDNPNIISFIKEVAPEEGQDLTKTDYIRIAVRAFKTFG